MSADDQNMEETRCGCGLPVKIEGKCLGCYAKARKARQEELDAQAAAAPRPGVHETHNKKGWRTYGIASRQKPTREKPHDGVVGNPLPETTTAPDAAPDKNPTTAVVGTPFPADHTAPYMETPAMTKDATKPAANGTCLVPNCDHKAQFRGLCTKHGEHLRRGNPEQKRIALAAQLPDKRLVLGKPRAAPATKTAKHSAVCIMGGASVDLAKSPLAVLRDRRLGQPTGVAEDGPPGMVVDRLLSFMGLQSMQVRGGTLAYDVAKDRYLLVSPIGQIVAFRLVTIDGQIKPVDLVEREEKPE